MTAIGSPVASKIPLKTAAKPPFPMALKPEISTTPSKSEVFTKPTCSKGLSIDPGLGGGTVDLDDFGCTPSIGDALTVDSEGDETHVCDEGGSSPSCVAEGIVVVAWRDGRERRWSDLLNLHEFDSVPTTQLLSRTTAFPAHIARRAKRISIFIKLSNLVRSHSQSCKLVPRCGGPGLFRRVLCTPHVLCLRTPPHRRPRQRH